MCGEDVLLELAAHDIREDLELAVRMRAKTRPGLDAVLIDDAEAAKLLVLRVVVAAVTLSARYSIHCQTIRAHLAKLNVWNVLSQPWSALPRSSLGRGMTFIV